MRPRQLLLPIVLLAASVSLAATPANPWPRWRGPQDNGGTDAPIKAVKFGPERGLAWKTKLPGKGCSTPILFGEHILLTAPIGDQDGLISYDLEGKKRWEVTVGQARGGKHQNGSGANPSAATDGQIIAVYFRSGNLACVDFDGKILWDANLQEHYGKDTLYWDLGTSPVLTSEHVVVAVMHDGESFLVAFEKETGKEAWFQPRNYQTPIECDHSYATPLVVDLGGRETILVWGAEHLTAHDAATGITLFECGGFNLQKKRNWVQVGSAVVVDGVAVIPYGRGERLAGVKLGGRGDVTETHRLWTRYDTGSFVPTPAIHGGKVYLVRDRGEVDCINPKSGKTLWSDRLPRSSKSYYASPLVNGERLYAAREDGVVFVARIAGGFKILAENDMNEQIIASPVPMGDGRLLLRGEEHLFCVAGE